MDTFSAVSQARELIPGLSMLISKSPDRYAPDIWPTYYQSASGVHVTALDGKSYLDFGIMSLGACSLGYANPIVNNAAKASIDNGVISSLNCFEEVELARRLVSLHPWADMARFTRSGGEANAVSVRIARAFTNRSKVAICGYHGWHDWYIATNLQSNSKLNPFVMAGLEPNGVPSELEGTTIPFFFNDSASFDKALHENPDMAAVKLEVQRSQPPNPAFLSHIRKECTRRGIVLIFDECTSGFRETLGGIHLLHGVEPDIAVFGKTLGNGFPICAVIGKKHIMQSVENTFISSTFWTERVGPSAALATLNVMEDIRSWEILPKIGRQIKSIWRGVASHHPLPSGSPVLTISGIDALPVFSFNVEHSLVAKTYLIQCLLDEGILSTNSFYCCTLHDNPDYYSRYRQCFAKSIQDIVSLNASSLRDKLRTRPCVGGFTRLNATID